jgi:hypothetical protein
MRWQRQSQALLDRFCDLTTSPDRLSDLGPLVVPTVLLGTDHPDDERATFIAYSAQNPPAGLVATGQLSAYVGDLELVAAWVMRPGGNLDCGVTINPSSFIPAVPPSVIFGSCSGPTHALVGFNSQALAVAPGFAAPASTVYELPLRGLILERGRELLVQSTNLGVAATVGFAWRNVGSAAEGV